MKAHPVHEIVSSSTQLDWIDLKHLHALTGQSVNDFDQVIVKELVDNAIDAAENAGKAPVVSVALQPAVNAWKITVSDNGPGLTADQVTTICTFTTRASSKDWRRAVTRGQQGNAFKTVVGIPVAFQRLQRPHDRSYHALDVVSGGMAYAVDVVVDAGTLTPSVREKTESGGGAVDSSTAGDSPDFSPSTSITVEIPVVNVAKVMDLLAGYVAVNPHLTVHFQAVKQVGTYRAVNPEWKPPAKSAIQWYTAPDFDRLCSAGRQLGWTVSKLIGSFAGCSAKSTIAEIMSKAGIAPRFRLADLTSRLQADLLQALRGNNDDTVDMLRPVGRERLVPGGRYARIAGSWPIDGAIVPFVVEVALLETNDERIRGVTTAINYTPTYCSPFPDYEFRHADDRTWPFQGTGLDGFLGAFYIDGSAPVRVVLHIICPRLDFRDRGKSIIDTQPELGAAVAQAIYQVAHRFHRDEQKHRREQERLRQHRIRQIKPKSAEPKFTEVMGDVIPLAYEQAAGSFDFAMQRQIMYKARPLFQEFITGKTVTDAYFTQSLLPRFIDENPEMTANWNVFADARGHLWEPHGGESVPLGTEQVRAYLTRKEKQAAAQRAYRFHTHGPRHRYNTILFIEKEGFAALLEESGLLDEYDVALMSTKGLSTTAARSMLEQLQDEVTILALHDFDITGTSIVSTLSRSTARFKFNRPPKIIDIGLRLDDVCEHGLPSESVSLSKDYAETLERNGCNEDEALFLLSGRRVELNAFGNDEFVDWVRGKLEMHAEKVIPTDNVLAEAYDQALRHVERQRLLGEVENKIAKLVIAPAPADIRQRVVEQLENEPTLSWDAALAQIVRGIDGGQ